MKRLLLFLGVFVSCITLLVLVLGPDSLFKELTARKIDPGGGSAQGPGITVNTSAGRFQIAGAGFIRKPLQEKVKDADGNERMEVVGVLELSDIQPAEPYLITGPAKLERYENGVTRLRVTSMRSRSMLPAGGMPSSAESLDIFEIRLQEDVRAEVYDPDGKLVLVFETDDLELPLKTPEGAEETSNKLNRANSPVSLFTPDGSLKLDGQGMEVDRVRHTVRILGPVVLSMKDFDLGALTGEQKPVEDSPSEKAEDMEPVKITSAGDLLYRKRVAETEAEPEASKEEKLDLEALVGSGTLLFSRDVVASQGDLQLNTDRLEIEVEREDPKGAQGEDAKPKLTARRLSAGDGVAPVRYSIRGGKGASQRLEWADGTLDLNGPVNLEDVTLEEGGPRVSLRAAEGLRLTEETAEPPEAKATDQPGTGSPLKLRHLNLQRNAALSMTSRFSAEAEEVVDVWFREKQMPPGETAPETGPEAAPEDSPKLDLERLELKGAAKLSFEAKQPGALSPTANADNISAQFEGDWLKVLLTGSPGKLASVELAEGFFEGPFIELRVQRKGDEFSMDDFQVIVPALTAAAFLAPGSFSFFPDESGDSKPGGGERELELMLSPSSPEGCDLRVGPTGYHVRRPCVYRTLEASQRRRRQLQASDLVLQELRCNELDMDMENGEIAEFSAREDVRFEDFESGMFVDAASVKRSFLEERVFIHGTPAEVRVPHESGIPIEVFGVDVEFNPVTRELFARADPERVAEARFSKTVDPVGRVLLRVPETLFPSSFLFDARAPEATDPGQEPAKATADVPPDPPEPLELRAMDVHFLAPEKGSPESQAHLTATGFVDVLRTSDRAHLRGHELVVDQQEDGGTLRLSGSPDGKWLAFVSKPKPYDESRVESVLADWVMFYKGGAEMDLAPEAVLVLHPEEKWLPGSAPPSMRKVQLSARGPATLRGHPSDPGVQLLEFVGGVASEVTLGDETGRRNTAVMESERLVVTIDAATQTPLIMHAQQLFHLRHPRFACEGGTLSVDFPAEELRLKAGSEMCRMVQVDGNSPSSMTSRFRKLTYHLKTGALRVEPFALTGKLPARGR